VLPLVLALLLTADAPPAAKKEERLDHHGAVGFIGGVTGLSKESNISIENSWRGGVDLGASFNVGYASNEILAVLRLSLGDNVIRFGQLGFDAQIWGGYRGYFGDRWKTLVDIGLTLNMRPGFTAGPRVGVGVQYELSSIAGIFATLGAQLGFGWALVFRAELMIGFQLRSFLLED